MKTGDEPGSRGADAVLFSQTAEYALRAAACLATAEPETLLSSERISEEAAIPMPYVAKVMRPLIAACLVEARRGRSGGFRLARAPAEITFHDILVASGAVPTPDRCAFGHDRCRPEDPCLLHDRWTELKEAFETWSHGSNLATLTLGSPLRPPGLSET